jgi:WD40 repeat protein
MFTKLSAQVRVKVTVNHIAFSPDGLCIVSSGTRHLKFWDLSTINPAASSAALTGIKASQMLQVRESHEDGPPLQQTNKY